MAVDYEEGRRLLAEHQAAVEKYLARTGNVVDDADAFNDARIILADWLWRNAEALLNPDPWRPIETAPTDGKSVLLACDYDRHGKQRVSLAWWDDQFDKSEISGCWIEGWFYDYQEHESIPMRVEFRPTHWKPLPAPPDKEGPGQ